MVCSQTYTYVLCCDNKLMLPVFQLSSGARRTFRRGRLLALHVAGAVGQGSIRLRLICVSSASAAFMVTICLLPAPCPCKVTHYAQALTVNATT